MDVNGAAGIEQHEVREVTTNVEAERGSRRQLRHKWALQVMR